jgi:glycosyltransferase involved in cell wall biosynthesis
VSGAQRNFGRPVRRESMAGSVLKIWILAGRLSRYDARWPLAPWLDRLERRGCRLQVLCLSKGNVLQGDPRLFELPALGSRWLKAFAARGLWYDDRLERPDLVHVVHDEMIDAALTLTESSRLPYIQTIADFRTVERGLRLSRRWCHHLVATGQDLAVELTDGLRVPAQRVTVIPPGIVLPHEPLRVTGTGRVPVIGTGGPLDEGSGLLVFLEAARRVLDAQRDVEFVIAGQGANQYELRRRAQQLRIGERVTMAELPSVGAEYWTVLDIYCQPSTVPSAGVPLLQAMAHAVACIATRVNGLSGLIEPGSTGLMIPPDDPQALETAILELLDHPDEARRLGRNARERVQTDFDPDVEADRLVELYRSVVESTRTEPPDSIHGT